MLEYITFHKIIYKDIFSASNTGIYFYELVRLNIGIVVNGFGQIRTTVGRWNNNTLLFLLS